MRGRRGQGETRVRRGRGDAARVAAAARGAAHTEREDQGEAQGRNIMAKRAQAPDASGGMVWKGHGDLG